MTFRCMLLGLVKTSQFSNGEWPSKARFRTSEMVDFAIINERRKRVSSSQMVQGSHMVDIQIVNGRRKLFQRQNWSIFED